MDSVYSYISENLCIKNKQELSFPFLDYGFLYGYGLFESIKVKDGIPLLLDYHVARLKRGSVILDIPFEYSFDDIKTHVSFLIEKNQVKESILNFYLTPGNRDEDPSSVQMNSPFFLMVNRVWPNYKSDYSIKLELRQESFKKTPLDRFKTLSWMKNILEKRLSPDSDDVLLYDEDGNLLEASRANVYFVKEKTIYTPKSSVVLPGVIRQFLIDNQNSLGVEIKESPIGIQHLSDFDEIFLSNALRGVFLVKDFTRFPGLVSGDVSKRVQAQFLNLLQPALANV